MEWDRIICSSEENAHLLLREYGRSVNMLTFIMTLINRASPSSKPYYWIIPIRCPISKLISISACKQSSVILTATSSEHLCPVCQSWWYILFKLFQFNTMKITYINIIGDYKELLVKMKQNINKVFKDINF